VEILQVVPELDAAGGVAAFAHTLAGALEPHGVRAPVVSPAKNGDEAGAAWVDPLGALMRGTTPVLLHYSNYGYARRGCPSALVRGLERWRANGGPRLVTFFHELYATGLPWQSSFWLYPWQRRLAARMSRTSDGVLTSLPLYAERLRGWSPGATVTALPVFSTLGESAAPLSVAERRPALVVLGSPGLRRRAYQSTASELAAACAALAVEEIVDVGRGEVAPPQVGGVSVRRAGFLGAGDAAALLAAARAGFLCYPSAFLGKSTVFAAYCAHGMVPVVGWPRERPAAGEPPCWQPALADAPDWQHLASRAHAWYRGHDLATHVDACLSLMR
jgi:hypothetical protein